MFNIPELQNLTELERLLIEKDRAEWEIQCLYSLLVKLDKQIARLREEREND